MNQQVTKSLLSLPLSLQQINTSLKKYTQLSMSVDPAMPTIPPALLCSVSQAPCLQSQGTPGWGLQKAGRCMPAALQAESWPKVERPHWVEVESRALTIQLPLCQPPGASAGAAGHPLLTAASPARTREGGTCLVGAPDLCHSVPVPRGHQWLPSAVHEDHGWAVSAYVCPRLPLQLSG